MKVTFEGTTREVVQEMLSFLGHHNDGVAATDPVMLTPTAHDISDGDEITIDESLKRQASEPEKKKKGGRRKETTEAKAAPAKKGSTKKKKATEDTPTISVEDLSKAASQAAADFSTDAVKDILTDFGVLNVNKIQPEDRQKFLDACDELS